MDSILSMFIAPVCVSLLVLGIEYSIRHRPIDVKSGTPSAGFRALLFLVPLIGAGLVFAVFSYDVLIKR